MSIKELQDFHLAGGTALALLIGHRISYDLDFFGQSELPMDDVLLLLRTHYEYQEMHRTENILVLEINEIKVDFVKYPYPLLKEPLITDRIRLLSIEDIAAMKLDAIKGRGRKRDFYDLYFLLQLFDLSVLLDWHLKKYQQNTRFLIMKSLSYFEDAENDPPVHLLNNKLSWEDVKKYIVKQLNSGKN